MPANNLNGLGFKNKSSGIEQKIYLMITKLSQALIFQKVMIKKKQVLPLAVSYSKTPYQRKLLS